jgi:hypothetical protein
MHFGTFPAIETDVKEIGKLADSMEPGESREY